MSNKIEPKTVWKLVKSVEFSQSAQYAPVKVNYGVPDRNANAWASKDEISYSSKTWFPELLFIRVTFKKSLKLQPLEIQHPLYLRG